MEKEFQDFIDSITLTFAQSTDAKTKYTGVCEKLYSHFYTGDYDDGKKFLFGSYKTKTNIRPLTSDQDINFRDFLKLLCKGKSFFQRLRELGINSDLAKLTSNCGNRYEWVVRKTCVVWAISKETLARRGLACCLDYYMIRHSLITN